MRRFKLLAVLCMGLTATTLALAQDRYGRHDPNLHGTWYLAGQADTRCYVEQPGRNHRPVFTNERGESAYGAIFRDRVQVPAWDDPSVGGLHGRVHGGVILWSNGTFWTRSPIF